MKILEINKFFFNKGGSESYYFELRKLLKEKGHVVMDFAMNHEKNEPSNYQKYFSHPVYYDHKTGFFNTIHKTFHLFYSFNVANKLRQLIKEQGVPDVAHLHNFYYQLTPAVVKVLREFNVPIVWTLHDYKVISPNYNLYTKGKIDESTKPDKYFKVLKNRAIKGSWGKSFLAALETFIHVKITKLYRKVDYYIPPSKFLAKLVEEYGLPSEKIIHQYNFIDLKEYKPVYEQGEYYLYVGRFIEEKGLMVLLKEFKNMPDKKLKIIGKGELQDEMEIYIEENEMQNVEILGPIYVPELYEYVQKSKALIIPSIWYENNPIIVLQAMALGKPIVGSNLGGIPELIDNDKTGIIFNPLKKGNLKKRLNEFESMDIKVMGERSRKKVEQIADKEEHYKGIMKVFERAKEQKD